MSYYVWSMHISMCVCVCWSGFFSPSLRQPPPPPNSPLSGQLDTEFKNAADTQVGMYSSTAVCFPEQTFADHISKVNEQTKDGHKRWTRVAVYYRSAYCSRSCFSLWLWANCSFFFPSCYSMQNCIFLP